MGNVIERLGHSIDDDGRIHYDERQSSFEAADALAGRRVDRRRNYCIMDGKLHEAASWTQPCADCTDGGEYPSGPGVGCSECGYHGVVRSGMWVEYEISEYCRREDASDRCRAKAAATTTSTV